MRQDLLDHHRLVNHRDQTTPTRAITLQSIRFRRQPHRHRLSQATRGLPGLRDGVMSLRRIRQRHLAVVACRLRLVAPPWGQRSSLDH
jgi:hypothetical protein